MPKFSEILTKDQLKKLDAYKYDCRGESMLDPFLQPLWNRVVQKLPLWLSPNLLTIGGLITIVLTTLPLLYYSQGGKASPPIWTFYVCAIGLFAYQGLDACDGKQARRTGSSSPLGEILDHGCDSICIIFIALGACMSTKLGFHPNLMFFLCLSGITLFYCVHWESYITGYLQFRKFDVSEFQMIIIIFHLMTAFFGTEVWSLEITSWKIEMLYIGICIAYSMIFFYSHNHILMLYNGGSGTSGSTIANTSILSPFIPLSTIIVPAIMYYNNFIVRTRHRYLSLYIITFGLMVAKVTNKLLIAKVTKSELEYLDVVLFGHAALMLNQYFNSYFDDYVVLWFVLIFTLVDLAYYITIVYWQICDHLNINMFTIRKSTSPM